MGYDVHITRAENWLDAEEKPILLPEWLLYVESDPEMRLDGEAVAYDRDGKPIIAIGDPGTAVWIAYSGHQEKGNKAWFDWREGCVVVKNPDDEIRGKMRRIAASLRAFVVGDEGEHY